MDSLVETAVVVGLPTWVFTIRFSQEPQHVDEHYVVVFEEAADAFFLGLSYRCWHIASWFLLLWAILVSFCMTTIQKYFLLSLANIVLDFGPFLMIFSLNLGVSSFCILHHPSSNTSSNSASLYTFRHWLNF